MSRAALMLTTGLALASPVVAAIPGGGLGVGSPTVPTTTVAATASTVAGATTTAVEGAAPTSTSVTTTVPRGGAASGSIAKPEGPEGWSVQRLITTTAVVVVALSAAGYAFGRFRSTPPVHPDLVRDSD